MLDDLVRQLTQELEMDPVTPLEKGHYCIPLAGEIKVDMMQLPHAFLFKSAICTPPNKNKELFYSNLMQANLFAQGTRGASIGLDADANVLTLSLELSYNSSYTVFKEKLEDFVSVLEFWRTEAVKL